MRSLKSLLKRVELCVVLLCPARTLLVTQLVPQETVKV